MLPALLRSSATVVVLILSSGLSAQSKGNMEVVFTPDMDRTTLTRIQEDAKANGLELTYTRVEQMNGSITALGFVLKTKAGMGTAETEELSADKPFGFRYDPKPSDGDAAFTVGSLKTTAR